jgi:hypothetical protein
LAADAFEKSKALSQRKQAAASGLMEQGKQRALQP